MKTRAVYILITMLLFVILMFSGCNQPSVERINAKQDIPVAVWEAFSEQTIEPGAYYFNPAFTESNEGYLIICGSKEFADGYDVKVEEVGFSGTLSTREGPRGNYNIKLTESSAPDLPSYNENFEYPFIFFKLSKGSDYDYIYKIESNGTEMEINYWWGKDEVSGTTSLYNYEIVQSKEDIPEKIWSKIETLNLEQGIFGFDQIEYELEAFYALIVGGEEYTDSFNIAFETMRHNERNSDSTPYNITVALLMRKYTDRGSLPYTDGFDLPFAVIKLEPRDKSKKIILLGELNHAITFFDNHLNESMLYSNRAMED